MDSASAILVVALVVAEVILAEVPRNTVACSYPRSHTIYIFLRVSWVCLSAPCFSPIVPGS